MAHAVKMAAYTCFRVSKHRLIQRLEVQLAKCLRVRNKFCVRFYTSKNILRLSERGLFKDIFPPNCPKFRQIVGREPISVYAGFDPTADSLHIGHLLVIIALLHCQRAGHKVIALVGGATAQIGDPSGRKTERDSLDAELINRNAKSIESNLRQVFKNHEAYLWKDESDSEPLIPLTVVDNRDWYRMASLLDFFASVGRNFRMGNMLSRDSVQIRLNSLEGMSFTEFTYQIFQAYDWLYLLKKYNCIIQIGGHDQLGNMCSGRDLIQRVEGKDVYGMTVPLITSEEGDKYGKTAGNAIWLNPRRTSPFELYQFLIRTKDSEVENLLKLFTFFPLANIQHIMEKTKETPWHAQRKLAEAVTLLVHGEEAVNSAKRISEALYSNKPESLVNLSEIELKQMFSQAPTVESLLSPGTTVLQMAMTARCFSDDTYATKIINAGGFYVNHRRVNNPNYILIPGEHILPNNISVLRVGKKNYYMVKWLT